MNKLNLTNPIIVDEVEYPFCSATLIISPVVENNIIKNNVVLTLKPFKEDEEGNITVLEENDISLIFGVDQIDADVSELQTNILNSIQTFIDNKSL